MNQPTPASPTPSLDALRAAAHDERFVALSRALGMDAELYLVGGTVRDALLSLQHQDLDLATSLPADEVMRRLANASIRAIPTGLKHETVSALVFEGTPIVEITTFRAPKGLAHAPRSLERDLMLRDFTINALAYEPHAERIIDPAGGERDLASRLLRAVGHPEERFQDDPLRLMRAVRFAVTLSLEIETRTEAAIKQCASLIRDSSIERVREEFSKILLSPAPARGLRLLLELDLLHRFLPEIARTAGFEQNRFHKADLFEHTLHVIEACKPELTLRLAALLHDVAKVDTLSIDPETGDRHFFKHEFLGAEKTTEILERLRYPNAVTRDAATLVRTHMRPLQAGPGGLRRLLRDTGELFEAWRELKEADAGSCKINLEELGKQFREFDEAMEEVKKGPPVSPLSSLAVNGHDLIAIGFRPGPALGEALRALHEQVLDSPELNTKEELLTRAEKLPGREGC